jgi:hypothetical protein
MGSKHSRQLHVGDIVMMRVAHLNKDDPLRQNINRLMRVTKVKKDLSQTGWVVNVKVNEHPLHDTAGNRVLELEEFDAGWFIKYETNLDNNPT